MKPQLNIAKLILCILILPGYFVHSQQGNWTFTLTDFIETSINSTVDIPCTFTSPEEPGGYHLVWYEYGSGKHHQIYNSNNQSHIHGDYKGRTSLIGHGTNCSLRITNVTKTAWYFPEITNSNFTMSNEMKPVKINVTGCLNRSTCSDWSFNFPRTLRALRGSCVEIPCTLTAPPNDMDLNLIWFLRTPTKNIVIYSNNTRLRTDRRYRNRTSLVRMRRSSCSLRISDVTTDGQYYPGVNRVINALNLDGKSCIMNVTDLPSNPEITGAENLKNSMAVNISCSVIHTCPSSRPTLQWSIQNGQDNSKKVNLSRGYWKEQSTFLYIPSIGDHNTSLECEATFPNGLSIVQSVTLLIEDIPQSSVRTIIIILVGLFCLLLLFMLFFIYKRKKKSHMPVLRGMGENSESMYTDLQVRPLADSYEALRIDDRGNSTTRHEREAPVYQNIQTSRG